MAALQSVGRRQQILEALARELESNPGSRVTTARLAAMVGVSEAALYRHFPSKAKMFEALIAFAEESVFGLVSRILVEQPLAAPRAQSIVAVTLTFSSRNPGITRVLLGDALVGEHQRLRARASQFFDRLETQLKQVLREGELREGLRLTVPVAAAARVLMAAVEGGMAQYVRSGFARPPTEALDLQWATLSRGLFT